MKKPLPYLLMLIAGPGLSAHPMGNFSISHYSKLQATGGGVRLEYVLDLAEIPTLDLLRSWQLERTSPRGELERKAGEQAKVWLANLKIVSDGKPVRARFESAKLVLANGAGDLPIIRVITNALIDARGGLLRYEDLNYPDRSGWKEIVIASGRGAALQRASQTGKDLSKALSEYPPDPTLAPPQDLLAELQWTVDRPAGTIRNTSPEARATAPAPVIAAIAQPRQAPAAASPTTMTAAGAQAGTVVKGDFLSRLLHHDRLTPWMILSMLAVAFSLGGLHALTPGHGKTIVAAYLVGTRGTLKHAAFLGAMVTFTHTISVFALGFATLFLFRYIVPEKITQVLGVISGLSIVAVGAWMLMRRLRGASHGHSHSHHHEHSHDHEHPHVHAPDHDATHSHSHGEGHDHVHPHTHSHDAVARAEEEHSHSHSHGPGGHSHIPDEMSWGGLVALGVSGGLVPCESALVLLLSAIALRRAGLGLLLLLAFSAGLALVLIVIGVLVLYAKNLIPESKRSGDGYLFRWLPVASAAVVMIVGVLMTVVSAGWISPKFMVG